MAVDPQQFKDTLARWVSGVTVVTTVSGSERKGATASSFISLSLEPPTILISLAARLYTRQLILETGIFAVSILNYEQIEIGRVFAGQVPEITDRFTVGQWTTAETGCPILLDANGWVDCRVYQTHEVGDHTLIVGEVQRAGASDADPLLYYRRQWGRFEA